MCVHTENPIFSLMPWKKQHRENELKLFTQYGHEKFVCGQSKWDRCGAETPANEQSSKAIYPNEILAAFVSNAHQKGVQTK